MNYYDIKFLHIALVILYVYSLLGLSRFPQKLFSKLFFIFTCIFLAGSGMASLSRLGIKGVESYPLWVWGKIVIFALLTVLPYAFYTKIIKREIQFRIFNFGFIILVLAASYMGVFKP